MPKCPLSHARSTRAPLTASLMTILTLALLIALLAPAPSQAQQHVYRSVDAQGHVSFSAEPPADPNQRSVEAVQLQPGPSEADIQAADERARDLQRTADEFDQQRQAAREASAKQRKEAATPPPGEQPSASPNASRDASKDADAWEQLLSNNQPVSPERRLEIDKAKSELLEARQQRPATGNNNTDLFQRPDHHYHRGRGKRE